MKQSAIKLIVAVAILSVTSIRGGQAEDVFSKTKNVCTSCKAYEVTIHTYQEKDSKSEQRTVKFSYMKPGWIRSEIIDGKNKGGIAVYNPEEGKVHAMQAGIPVPVILSPDAALTRSIRGNRIYEGSFDGIVRGADRNLSKGATLSYIGEESVDGALCLVIEFKIPADVKAGIVRERWWIDKNTFFPRRISGYDKDGKELEKTLFKNLKLNVEFKTDFFKL